MTWPRETTAVLLLRERVRVEAVVQRIHEQHKQQRSEWIALTQTATHRKARRVAVDGAHARLEPREAVLDEKSESRWEL